MKGKKINIFFLLLEGKANRDKKEEIRTVGEIAREEMFGIWSTYFS